MNRMVGMLPRKGMRWMGEGKMVEMMVLSVLVGFGMRFVGKKVWRLGRLVEQGKELMR